MSIRKSALLTVTLSALVALGAACSSDPGASEDTGSAASAATTAVTTGVTYDTTAIQTHPGASLPAAPLPASAFNLANVSRSILRSSDIFTTTARVNAREVDDAPSWHVEIDGSRGQVLAVSPATPGAPVAQDERLLESAAMQRLSNFGVPTAEVFAVWQRRSETHDEDGTLGTPEIDGYKTFAIRGINNVRIRGHRAVLTYGRDGVFRRTLVKWPALAATGHKLRSPLTADQILARAQSAVAAQGVVRGNVVLNWVYVPTPTTGGTVTLTLKVVARVPFTPETQEPRQIDVDVDAS